MTPFHVGHHAQRGPLEVELAQSDHGVVPRQPSGQPLVEFPPLVQRPAALALHLLAEQLVGLAPGFQRLGAFQGGGGVPVVGPESVAPQSGR